MTEFRRRRDKPITGLSLVATPTRLATGSLDSAAKPATDHLKAVTMNAHASLRARAAWAVRDIAPARSAAAGKSYFLGFALQICKAKLKRYALGLFTAAPQGQRAGEDDQAGSLPQERMPAFDQVSRTLKFEVCRNHHLYREITALRVVLAQMQEELTASRASEKRARHLALHDSTSLLADIS